MNDRAASGSGGPVGVLASAPAADPVGRPASEEERHASRQEVERLRALLQAADARERMLRHDLQHRVRNMLAVIRSVFRRTRESGASQDEFAEHFEGRLDAIARHQSVLGGSASGGVEIENIVREELVAVGCSDGPMCAITGPTVLLADKAVELMGLAIHELTTNSVKFGALAHGGSMRVEWSVDGSPPDGRMRLRWIETGVPMVTTAPRAQGFGRQLIEEALPYQLGAETSFDLRPGGVSCSIALPLSDSAILPETAGASAAQEPTAPPAEPEPRP